MRDRLQQQKLRQLKTRKRLAKTIQVSFLNAMEVPGHGSESLRPTARQASPLPDNHLNKTPQKRKYFPQASPQLLEPEAHLPPTPPKNRPITISP